MQLPNIWSVRRALEYLLIAALVVMPLLVAIRFRWAQLVIPIAVAPAIALLVVCGPERTVILEKLRSRFFTLPVLIGLAFCLWLALTIAWAPNRAYATGITTRVIGLIVGALIIQSATLLTARAALLWPLLWTWSVAAVATILMIWTDGGIHRQFGCCAGGMQADMTGSAVMLVLLLWPCAGWLFMSGQRAYAVIVIALVCAIAATSGSGASVLAIVAGGATVVIGLRFPRMAIALPLAILLAGFAAIFLLSQLNAVTNSVAILDGSTGFHSAERLRIWAAYTDLFWHRPWTGFGPGSERFLNSPALRDAFVVAAAPDAVRLHSHTLPLQIIVQTGIVGTALLLAAGFAATIRALKQPHSLTPFAVAPVSSYLAAGMVNFGIWEWWWLTLILVAMIFATRLLADEELAA